MANLFDFVVASGNNEVQYLIKQVSPCLALESLGFHFIVSNSRRCTAFRREADTTLHLARTSSKLYYRELCINLSQKKPFLKVSELFFLN